MMDGRRIELEIKYYALVDQARAAQLIPNTQMQELSPHREGLRLVIGDRIVQGARDLLREANVSWFDLRGHLYLSAPGLRIDTTTDASAGKPTKRKPLRGQVGLATAVDVLLCQPHTVSVRETARRVGAAASTVSEVMSSLRREGVIDQDGAADFKALFWLAAAEWSPNWIPVDRYPDPFGAMRNPALQLRLDDRASAGWALGGDYAAAYLGAPIGLASGGPLDLYVPTRTAHRLATSILGSTQEASTPKARLAVAPVNAVCKSRIDLSSSDQHWLLTRPLFIALDLAQDPGRGAEILQGWNPGDWGRRVW